MIKTVKIGNKDVVLDNNVGWTLIYRDQFGQDIVPTIMPLLAGTVDVISGVVKETNGELSVANLAKVIDGDSFINAIVHIGGFEFVDFLHITWAMAKNADDSILEPDKWIREFDEFPVDVVGPEIAKLIFKGMVSSKNQRRLNVILKSVQPKKKDKSISTQSSSPESNEG